nr:immunoglobulin heavy chain junction region [Mus musculus]
CARDYGDAMDYW